MTGPSARSYTIRDTGPIVVFGVAIAVVAGLTVLFWGEWVSIAQAAPFVTLTLWAVWLVLVHPHVRYDDAGLRVVNIGRIHEVPWSRVAHVQQRVNLVVELHDGRRITAAGASASRGPGAIVAGITGRIESGRGADRNAETLEAYRAVAPPSTDPVRTRWDTVPLIVGVILAVAALVNLAALAV